MVFFKLSVLLRFMTCFLSLHGKKIQKFSSHLEYNQYKDDTTQLKFLALKFPCFSVTLTERKKMLWLSKERNCCRFNCATFRLPFARSLCCLSKEFASKKRKKFLDGHRLKGRNS